MTASILPHVLLKWMPVRSHDGAEAKTASTAATH